MRSFDRVVTDPWNLVFHVVFFPDRIYHAQYLNATRSERYRYDVQEVRGKADMNVLRGDVYIDGTRAAGFLRVEYRASRLVEVVRERGRFVRSHVMARVGVLPPNAPDTVDRYVYADLLLTYCPWIDAFQAEVWSTLEPPPGKRHDWQVLDMIGADGSITTSRGLAPLLDKPRSFRRVRLALREPSVDEPSGYFISNPAWDNSYERNVQVPRTGDPSSHANTVVEHSYALDFQRGWYVQDIASVPPVRYRNAMMDERNPERREPGHPKGDNVLEMRWILQQELGGTLVFFHEVTIPPDVVEGTHQHIGSEELYLITEGAGEAYLGVNDDPDMKEKLAELGLSDTPVERHIYGVGFRKCYAVPVRKGSVIFTKSGGIHGIRNTGASDLKFVAFLYHSS